MAQGGGFTGNPDIDVRILFSLPDRELRRLCQVSSYLRNLCTDPQYDMYWRERFAQRFPYELARPLTPIGWRSLYWYTLQTSQLPLEDIAEQLEEVDPALTYLAKYLQVLSQQLYWAVDHRSLAELQELAQLINAHLATHEHMDRHVWVNSIFSTLLGRLRAAKNQQRLQALICGDAVIGPWLLNQVILASSFRNLLPEVSFAVPITVHIGQQKGTHLLTQDQFMGMLLYVNYAAKQPVEFLLAGTPLHFTPEDLHKLYNTGVYIITMLGGDEFSFYRPEFMQGFITMARWLGANYRAGYRDIRERQHREACVVS